MQSPRPGSMVGFGRREKAMWSRPLDSRRDTGQNSSQDSSGKGRLHAFLFASGPSPRSLAARGNTYFRIWRGLRDTGQLCDCGCAARRGERGAAAVEFALVRARSSWSWSSA